MKDLQVKTRALSSLLKDIAKNKYDFNHPLQRQSGQWNKLSMSKLIDSAIRLYPIYPALVVDNGDDTYGVIDGKQRLTIFTSYANNEFALHKSLSPVDIDGTEYEIAGKKFDKLDEEVKERFKAREFQLYIMTNATENDIREIFARINSSKGLTNTQKRTVVENEELAKVVFELKSHPVFTKLTTPTQRKKDEDKDIVRQVLMLSEMSNEYDFGSFRNEDINKFIERYNGNINYGKVETIKEAMTALDTAFETISVNKVTVPILLYGYYRIVKDKKGMQKWNDWVKNFIETYDTNEEYKQYCNGSGTASSEMVKGRLQYFRDAIKEL
jgi:hypothetical protein